MSESIAKASSHHQPEDEKGETNGKTTELRTDNFAALITDKARGMTKLNKTVYNVEMYLPAVKCKAKLCGKFLSAFKSIVLKRPHFRKVIPATTEKESRVILLDPSINKLDKLDIEQQKLIKDEEATYFSDYTVPLTYNDFNFNEIVHSIIPEDVETINAFETIGHIAHVNLKDHLKEYKYVIGMLVVLFCFHMRGTLVSNIFTF